MFDRVIELLVLCYEFDVWVFSQWWLYAPFLIPAIFYLAFFTLKWSVLTAPIWIPISLIARLLR